MAVIIDFHAHVFEDNFKKWFSRIPFKGEGRDSKLDLLRRRGRSLLKPIAGSLHAMHTTLRYLPEPIRKSLDEMSALVPLPHLIFESTVADLIETMTAADVKHSLLIAHPPLISNEFILSVCRDDPRFIPVVNVPKKVKDPRKALQQWASEGARVLKIHPVADAEGPDSERYYALITTATELGLPVILHTGCVHTHLLYKNPAQGGAQVFEEWYKSFPETPFVLAHMNFHDPQVALDLCEKYPNVYVDTSWQPTEIIGEAVRRIGAERILFGTDWPLVGDNISVGLKRIHEGVEIGLFNQDQADLILGKNAMKLLGLKAENLHAI